MSSCFGGEMIVLWESHEEMSGNTREVSGGGGWRRGETMPCGGIANRDACWEGRGGGWGGGTLCSIQKSRKATKNGRGQATFPFPSPHNLSQTIKIIISPLPLQPSRRPTGRRDHPSHGPFFPAPESSPGTGSLAWGCGNSRGAAWPRGQ